MQDNHENSHNHSKLNDPHPYNETVDMVEDLVVEFITEMSLKA